jgi:uncharacterized membrane protein YfcA
LENWALTPWSIMNDGNFDGFLLIINLLVSAIGGIVGLIVIKLITNRLNKK